MAELQKQPGASPASTPSSVEPSRGNRLGKYQITGRLGQGGMGVVYEALDPLLKRKVAIKLLPKSVSTSAEALKRFLLEAQAAARLQHPNVVAIHEVDQREGAYFIVMELVDGGSAQQGLKENGAYRWPVATRMIADACRGLAAAHAAGFIHRDIKPANIMCTREGSVKLADFGLVKAADQSSTSLTAAGNVVGTPNYMSPEQCRSETLDFRSDLYSLGATYYALLVGRPPYQTHGPLEAMFAHCGQPVPDPRTIDATIPEACANIVRRAMAKAPGERYGSALEMLAALEAVLEAVTTSHLPPTPSASVMSPTEEPTVDVLAAFPPTTPMPARPRALRQWRLVAAVSLAAVCIAAGVFLYDHLTSDAGEGDRPRPPGNGQPAEDRRPLRARATEAGYAVQVGQPVRNAVFIGEGNRLALATPKGVRLCELDKPPEAMTTLWANLEVRCLAYAPNTRLLAAGTADGAGIKLYHAGAGQESTLTVSSLDGARPTVTALAFARDGWLLLAGLDRGGKDPLDRYVLEYWDTGSKKVQGLWKGHKGEIWSIDFMPTGVTALTGAADGAVKHWDVRAGTVGTDLPRGMGLIPPSHVFSPDRKLLAAAVQGTLEFWDYLPWKQRKGPNQATREIYCLAFSPNSKRLALGNHHGEVELWDVDRFEQLAVLKGHTGPVHGVAFSADGSVLISGGSDGVLKLWDVRRR